MIWERRGPFRFYSESDGAARESPLAIESFGLRVREVQYCIKVLATGGTGTPQVGLKHQDSPDDDPATTPRLQSTPISVQTPSSTLPALLAGSTGTTTPALPFFNPTIVVQDSMTTAPVWVELVLFLGGKPF